MLPNCFAEWSRAPPLAFAAGEALGALWEALNKAWGLLRTGPFSQESEEGSLETGSIRLPMCKPLYVPYCRLAAGW